MGITPTPDTLTIRAAVDIFFGDERSGLTNEEVRRCHDLSAVPTDPAGSLRLDA